MIIKTVFFDLGKVLVDFEWTKSVKAIAAQSGMREDEIIELVAHGKLATEFERGHISSQQFFETLKKVTEFRGTIDQLRISWSDIFVPVHRHIALAQELSVHFPLGIISNTNEAHIRWIEKRFDFFKFFATKIFSFQTGYLKPQREIYEIALSGSGFKPAEALFIDDLELNVGGAAALGWKTVHLKGNTDLRQELKKLSIKV